MMIRFILPLLLLPALLFARPYPPAFPCEVAWGLWCGHVEVFGEYLYMRPSVDSLAFYILDPRPYQQDSLEEPPVTTEQVGPIGAQAGVRPGYHSGFRVGAAYVTPSQVFDLTGRYTRMHTSDQKRVTPSPSTGGLWAVFLNNSNPVGANLYTQNILFNPSGDPAFPGEIDAFACGKASFNLDSGDLTLGTRNTVCCSLWTRGFVGVHYANLLYEFDTYYQGTLSPGPKIPPVSTLFFSQALMADVKFKSRAWGVGPQLGVDLIYEIGCGFGISGRFALGLLGGSRKISLFEHFQTITTTVDPSPTETADRITDFHSCWETVVARFLDTRLGISYLFCCPCAFLVLVEFGYEFLQYQNMLFSRPTFRMDRGHNGVPCINYSLDGFYLHLTVSF